VGRRLHRRWLLPYGAVLVQSVRVPDSRSSARRAGSTWPRDGRAQRRRHDRGGGWFRVSDNGLRNPAPRAQGRGGRRVPLFPRHVARGAGLAACGRGASNVRGCPCVPCPRACRRCRAHHARAHARRPGRAGTAHASRSCTTTSATCSARYCRSARITPRTLWSCRPARRRRRRSLFGL
jgi:hypothetical protein